MVAGKKTLLHHNQTDHCLKNADVYVHTPENFVTAKENTESLYWHDAHLGKILVFSVKKLQQHDTVTPLVRSVIVLCHT